VTSFPWPDALVILGLVVLNGLFSMSELAIVSARRRAESAGGRGSGGARVALDLAADPGKFLSTVQIGITLVGIVAGAYSGSSLGGRWASGWPHWACRRPMPPRRALPGDCGTTYLSLVVGELVPKQLALSAAEPIAVVAARPMVLMARITAPFVWTLNRSSGLILRLLGWRGEQEVTAEELQMIFAEATRSGVIEEEERALMTSVMPGRSPGARSDDAAHRAALDRAGRQPADLDEAIEDSPHSLLLVADGSVDRIVGVVKVRDMLAARLRGTEPLLGSLMRSPRSCPTGWTRWMRCA
jgi:putative hemolysin